MPSRRTEFSRRAVRWLLPAAALALVPKCLLCVLAYAGFGAALGLGSPEICGASANPSVAWISWLLIPGAVLVFHRWRVCMRRVCTRKVRFPAPLRNAVALPALPQSFGYSIEAGVHPTAQAR